MVSESSIPLANSFSHTFERFLGADDRSIFANLLTASVCLIVCGYNKTYLRNSRNFCSEFSRTALVWSFVRGDRGLDQ